MKDCVYYKNDSKIYMVTFDEDGIMDEVKVKLGKGKGLWKGLNAAHPKVKVMLNNQNYVEAGLNFKSWVRLNPGEVEVSNG